jgi:hypothetical protein
MIKAYTSEKNKIEFSSVFTKARERERIKRVGNKINFSIVAT